MSEGTPTMQDVSDLETRVDDLEARMEELEIRDGLLDGEADEADALREIADRIEVAERGTGDE